jgi:hypothetical protein
VSEEIDADAREFGAHMTEEQREDLGRGLAVVAYYLQRHNEIMIRNLSRPSPLKSRPS